MDDILEWLVTAEDPRQQAKVKHSMKDIIAIVFFAELVNATEWIEIYLFAAVNEKALRKYPAPPRGIPSHDTIQRVLAMVSPECLREFRKRWEVLADDKSNEITAIPELLKPLNIKGNIVTIDAIGRQTDIARLIRKRNARYVLGLKWI